MNKSINNSTNTKWNSLSIHIQIANLYAKIMYELFCSIGNRAKAIVEWVEKVLIFNIVNNWFYRKLIKNGKIIQFAGGGRGISSPNPTCCKI